MVLASPPILASLNGPCPRKCKSNKQNFKEKHLGCWVRRIQSLRLIWPTKWDPLLTNKKWSSKRKRRGQEGERKEGSGKEEGRRRKKERKSEANMDVFKSETLHQVLISSADSELFLFLNSLLVSAFQGLCPPTLSSLLTKLLSSFFCPFSCCESPVVSPLQHLFYPSTWRT